MVQQILTETGLRTGTAGAELTESMLIENDRQAEETRVIWKNWGDYDRY